MVLSSVFQSPEREAVPVPPALDGSMGVGWCDVDAGDGCPCGRGWCGRIGLSTTGGCDSRSHRI